MERLHYNSIEFSDAVSFSSCQTINKAKQTPKRLNAKEKINFLKKNFWFLTIMNFKKVILIFVLLFSFTWAVNSNDPRNDDEINPENELLSSSDESDDGKFQIL